MTKSMKKVGREPAAAGFAAKMGTAAEVSSAEIETKYFKLVWTLRDRDGTPAGQDDDDQRAPL